jgi:hypothetical protein
MSEHEPTREQRIEERAYALWELAGRPQGRDEEFWEQAYQEVTAEDTPIPPRAEA